MLQAWHIFPEAGGYSYYHTNFTHENIHYMVSLSSSNFPGLMTCPSCAGILTILEKPPQLCSMPW